MQKIDALSPKEAPDREPLEDADEDPDRSDNRHSGES
jgi:hypothetical protein